MIHNSSADPVLIKKISLKIWSLRDEIEARIQEKLVDTETLDEQSIMQIREQFTQKKISGNTNNLLELKATGDLDSGEDEMAKAMAQAANEELSEEQTGVEKADEEIHGGAQNVVSLSPDLDSNNENIISISLDAPNIPEEKIARGKTVLAEINMEKMFFFCNKPFTEGQSIVIQFCIPKSFIVNADILYCRPFNLKSRIISQNNYTHRAIIKFKFLKEGERALLRQFLQSIEPDLTKNVAKTTNAEEADSGFGELDDLGL